MNILLNIPEDVVEKFQAKADLDKRSRKNLMEKVLCDYFGSSLSMLVNDEVGATTNFIGNKASLINQIKWSCPSNLTGLARTAWIADEKKRQGLI
jgi:hypothetical protein